MKNLLQIAACAVAVFTALSSTAMAQSSQPYSGMQGRPIKAVADQEVADLKAGRGMGLALAAELNGYPGPSHLLELSDKLGLTSDQHSALKGMFDAMKAETIPNPSIINKRTSCMITDTQSGIQSINKPRKMSVSAQSAPT